MYHQSPAVAILAFWLATLKAMSFHKILAHQMYLTVSLNIHTYKYYQLVCQSKQWLLRLNHQLI